VPLGSASVFLSLAPSLSHPVCARACGAVGKDKTGMSDPYVTVEYEKDLFETNFCVQTLNPRWDEQITL
jgi:Ca2+-dependent lipid-binding protein